MMYHHTPSRPGSGALRRLARGVPAALLAVTLTAGAGEDRETLYQVSTIDALLAGVYQPLASLAEVLPHGDLGLGTFEALDGALILLDGIVYQAAADGQVRVMPAETRVPFITLTQFDADLTLSPTPGMDYAAFKTWLEERLPSRNIAYAIRIDGQFASVRYRSVPRQQPPYPPLLEAAKDEVYFDRGASSGTLVGFWCPAFTKGVGVPGFHLHFLTDDRHHGGHVLDFQLAETRLQLDPTSGWEIRLPEAPAFLEADLGADRTQALQRVEHGNPPAR